MTKFTLPIQYDQFIVAEEKKSKKLKTEIEQNCMNQMNNLNSQLTALKNAETERTSKRKSGSKK